MRQDKSLATQVSRRTFAKGTLAAVVGLSLSTGSVSASEASADLVTGPDEEPIGSIAISEDDGSLTVTYTIDDEEYEITETHLHVADDVDDIPTNKPGNPKVGHFDHSTEHEEGTGSVTHEIDVSELGDELVAAAQAEVRTEVEEEEEEEEEPEYEYESVWADGERINDWTHPRHGHYLGSWAMYVTYQRAADESDETDETDQ